MVFYIHPVWQFMATILSVYVFCLGWPRLWATFSGGKATFLWKRHVALGRIALSALFLGLLGGAAVTAHFWGGLGFTQHHYWIGLAMAPLMLFGLVSGWLLDKNKGKYKHLPLLHGVNNSVVVLMALVQVWTGINVLRFFVL